MMELLNDKAIWREIFDGKKIAWTDEEVQSVLGDAAPRKDRDDTQEKLDDAVFIIAPGDRKNVWQMYGD